MVQSIEVLLDEASDREVRSWWSALADAGLPSLASHTGATNRPHVTLAVTDGSGFTAAEAALRAVAAGWGLAGAGLAAEIGAPVLFGGRRGRWVLARQVVPSRPLLTLHAAVHRALHGTDVVDHTAPDAWTPHVTLAHRIPAEDLPAALDAVEVESLSVRITGMRLWDSPSKTVTPLTDRRYSKAPGGGQAQTRLRSP